MFCYFLIFYSLIVFDFKGWMNVILVDGFSSFMRGF